MSWFDHLLQLTENTPAGQALAHSLIKPIKRLTCLIKSFKDINNTAQKMRFSIKNFFSKWDQIRRKLRIWSHLLKKPLMENFIFCAVYVFKHSADKQYLYKFKQTQLEEND